MASPSVENPSGQTFTLFPLLPFELRLKVFRHALYLQPGRIVEITVNTTSTHQNGVPISPSKRPHSSSSSGFHPSAESNSDTDYKTDGGSSLSSDLSSEHHSKPLTWPNFPSPLLHVCRDSRSEVLKHYIPINAAGGHLCTFHSPFPFPRDLFNPELDMLYNPMPFFTIDIAPIPLPSSSDDLSSKPRTHTPPAETFVLDWLAFSPPVSNTAATSSSATALSIIPRIQRLAIHLTEFRSINAIPPLLSALEPYTSLKELVLVLFGLNGVPEEVRVQIEEQRGMLKVKFVEAEEKLVEGAYARRMLGVSGRLVQELNEGLEKWEGEEEGGRDEIEEAHESKKGYEDEKKEKETRGRRWPRLKIMAATFEEWKTEL